MRHDLVPTADPTDDLMPRGQTPAELGYRFPAEWEPHAATWLAWPHKPETWPGKFEPIPAVWAELVRNIAQFEHVHVLAGGKQVHSQAQSMVGHVANVTIHDVPTNDVWMRDHGPMFLSGPRGSTPALVDWEYNAWGGKYPPFDLDNLTPKFAAKVTHRKRFVPGIIMEGGALDSNGQGTILTTEQCLLNPNRNPKLSRSDVERYLVEYCGARKILWLGEGIEGDDTDGHIDELARFVSPTRVLTAVEEDTSDFNHAPLADNFRRLQSMTDADGRKLEVIPVPMPRRLEYDGQRLPASYMNFYIANGVVIFPTFDDLADEAVRKILQECFPTREIRGQDAVDLFWGLGAFHCITQQQPA
jgi:agmatine deiminase